MIALDFSTKIAVGDAQSAGNKTAPLGLFLLACVQNVKEMGGPDLRDPNGFSGAAAIILGRPNYTPVVDFGIGVIRGAGLVLGLEPHELVARLDAWKAGRS